MAKCPILVSGILLFIVLLLYVQEVRSAPSLLLNDDTLYKDRTATRRLIMNQLKGDKEEEEAAALPRPPAGELDREERHIMSPTIDTSPRKLQFVKVSHFVYFLRGCISSDNVTDRIN